LVLAGARPADEERFHSKAVNAERGIDPVLKAQYLIAAQEQGGAVIVGEHRRDCLLGESL
jgi:hypothetical protein